MKKLEHKLKALGYIPYYPDTQDKGYIVYRKDYKHPILKNLHICIDNEFICVFCEDTDHQHDVVICKDKRTLKSLYKILIGLKIFEG